LKKALIVQWLTRGWFIIETLIFLKRHRVSMLDTKASSDVSAPDAANQLPASKPRAWAALRSRDFLLFWSGQFISITGSQMQNVAVNWHVYVLTKSAFALGMVGLVRVVPIVLCSLIGGVVADTFNRKRLLLITQTTMLLSAALLALLTANGLQSPLPIYALTAISAAATAFDNPARQALLPSLVAPRDLPNAVSLYFIAFQTSMVIGPLIGGVMLGEFGPASVYAVNAASFLAVIAALLLVRASGRAESEKTAEKASEEAKNRVSFAALVEGLRFVWRTPILVQTMALDFVATFFVSSNALLPIFAADILRVGAHGLGVLAAASSIGAVLMGLILTRRPEWKRPGLTILLSVAAYGAATIGFGLSRAFWFSILMLAISGAADTISTVIRQTIRQLVTPDRLRGRMTSVSMVFFMGGPQLGELEAGVVAKYFGAPFSVVIGGIGCLIAVALAAIKAKTLLRYEWNAQANNHR
jgi:MFS family permease